MGRIRGKWIKNLAKKFIEKFPDRFGTNFEENKKALEVLKLLDDKPIRNKVAGYIVDLKQKAQIE
jgi:small subunit ribosomal protein S17e